MHLRTVAFALHPCLGVTGSFSLRCGSAAYSVHLQTRFEATGTRMSSDGNKRVLSAVHDDSNNILAPSPQTTMSVQDVRTKRLLALGIIQAQPFSKEEVNKLLLNVKDRSNGINGASHSHNNAETKPQIIDLLNDSSDDDDILVVAKRIQRRNGSDDDILEEAKRLEKRKSTHAAEDEDTNQAKKPKAAGKAKQVSTKPPSTSFTLFPRTTSTKTSRSTDQTSKESTTSSFQTATWNVWFGPQGNGSPHAAVRMRAISRLLKEQHADDCPLWCIGLQEVVEETASILQPSLQCAGYQVYRQPLSPPYGCALAVHSTLRVLEQGWIPFAKTSMSRGFLYARVEIPWSVHQIIFTTTHLESYNGPSYTGAQQRPLQLRQMQDYCVQQFQTYPNLKTAVMTGDMNWDDERTTRSSSKASLDPVMATVLNDAWNDSWLESKTTASATCYTYDGKLNPMLGGNLRRRFDRIVVHGSNTNTVSTKLLGTEALSDLTWSKYSDWTKTSKEMPTAPSDHFGYVARFRMNDR